MLSRWDIRDLNPFWAGPFPEVVPVARFWIFHLGSHTLAFLFALQAFKNSNCAARMGPGGQNRPEHSTASRIRILIAGYIEPLCPSAPYQVKNSIGEVKVAFAGNFKVGDMNMHS